MRRVIGSFLIVLATTASLAAPQEGITRRETLFSLCLVPLLKTEVTGSIPLVRDPSRIALPESWKWDTRRALGLHMTGDVIRALALRGVHSSREARTVRESFQNQAWARLYPHYRLGQSSTLLFVQPIHLEGYELTLDGTLELKHGAVPGIYLHEDSLHLNGVGETPQQVLADAREVAALAFRQSFSALVPPRVRPQ